MTNSTPIVTTKQAAEMLGNCGTSTVGRFCKIGKLKAKKQSGVWLIDLKSVQELAKTYTPEAARAENGRKRAGMMRRKRKATGTEVAQDKPRPLSATEKAVLKYGPDHEENLKRIRAMGNRL